MTRKAIEHKWIGVESHGLIDRGMCSCGWQSAPYYDGREYAESEWAAHIKSAAEVRQAFAKGEARRCQA